MNCYHLCTTGAFHFLTYNYSLNQSIDLSSHITTTCIWMGLASTYSATTHLNKQKTSGKYQAISKKPKGCLCTYANKPHSLSSLTRSDGNSSIDLLYRNPTYSLCNMYSLILYSFQWSLQVLYWLMCRYYRQSLRIQSSAYALSGATIRIGSAFVKQEGRSKITICDVRSWQK